MWLPFLVAVLGACGDGAVEPPRVVRDSAGVVLIDVSRAPVEPVIDLEAVDPVVEIGTAGSGTTLFQVAGGARLRDGRIVLAESSSGLVRVFSSSGEPLSEFGGAGEGPEEFRFLAGLHVLPGDTLLLWDPRARRVTVATPGGAVVRQRSLPFESGGRLPRLVPLASGSLVASVLRNPGVPEPGARPGIERRDETVIRIPADGSAHDTLGVYPGAEFMTQEVMGRTLFGSAPFPRDLSLDVRGDEVVIGPAEGPEFSVIDTLGTPQVVIRMPNLRRPVMDRDRATVEETVRTRSRTEAERQMADRILETMVYPDSIQPYSGIRVGKEGGTFVRVGAHYVPVISSREWLEFDDDWNPVGLWRFPRGFEPLEFGEDGVLGVRTDTLGVETVQLFPR